MPDLGPLAGAVLELLTPALKALLRTTAGMIGLAVLLAGGSFYLAAQGSLLRGVLALVLALIICTIIGSILAVKRAGLKAVAHGLARLDLGGRALALVFGRLLGVSEAEAMGQRGGAIARTVERLPLAEAEGRLTAAIDGLLAAGEGGFLRGLIRRQVLKLVQRVTLARFREEGQKSGGVDLIRVRDELATNINDVLVGQVDAMLTRLTVGLVLLCLALSSVGALLVRRLPI